LDGLFSRVFFEESENLNILKTSGRADCLSINFICTAFLYFETFLISIVDHLKHFICINICNESISNPVVSLIIQKGVNHEYRDNRKAF